MICKESIITWFKELESYRRIDTMCSLLNMLLPFELRFLGTCLEELGRRDSQELRGIELRANNQQELAIEIANWQCGEPTDIKIRRKMALYLALIRSCNSSCVNELYKTLDGWGDRDFLKMTDLDTLQELLLVYSMANHHPAFSVEQRLKFGEIFMKIQENKLISNGTQQHHQYHQQLQHQQQNMISHHHNIHNLHGHHHQTTTPQQIHPSIQVIQQGNIPIGYPQGPITQIIPSDGSIQQQIAVDGIHHIIPTNMTGLSSEYTVVGGPHPNTLTWAIRPNLTSYPPPQQQQQQQTSIEHPPQSSSPMLSQQSSPSNSRTTSPTRSTANMIQLQQQQQQQIRNPQPQRVVLRNSRRPSTETTPPPVMVQPQQQQQQQIISLIGSNDIILSPHIKEEVFINADGTISPFTRNGYTRGHHTIPRPSKSSIHLQHHNQQQHQQQIQAYLAAGGGGPASLPPNFGLPNSSLAYTLQNMTLIDCQQQQQQQHNPSIIIENNLMTTTANSSSTTNSNSSILNSNRHKNNQQTGGGSQTGIINPGGGSGSDSGSSIGSTGELSPPETPTIIGTLTQANNIRLTDQQQQHNIYSKQLNQRLNGRPDKLLTNVGGPATFLYAPINATSPNQQQQPQQYQQQMGNDLVIQQQQSTNANNNNNSQQQNSTLNSNSSNNNLVTSTIVLTSPSSGLVQQQQLFSAPYYSPHLTPTQRATILTTCHNPQSTQSGGVVSPQQGQPGSFRHPAAGGGFQIQPNGDILYPFPQGAAGGIPTFVPQPITLRSSPSQTLTTQTQSTQSQQQQLQQPIPLPTNPNTAALLAASPFTTLTAGLGGKQILSCYNCGGQSHTGRDCHEASMEDATRGAIYKLDYSAAAAAAAAAAAVAASSAAGHSNNSSNLSSSNSSTTINVSNSSSNISNNSNSSSGSVNIATAGQSATTSTTTDITTDAASSPTSSSSSLS